MLRVVRNLVLCSAVVDLIAWVVFWFTDQRGMAGYANVLMLCALGVAGISCLAIMGSAGPRRMHDEHLQFIMSDAAARREDRAERERGLSFGLLAFLVALLSGATGMAVAHFAAV
jgi:hypothetical protein